MQISSAGMLDVLAAPAPVPAAPSAPEAPNASAAAAAFAALLHAALVPNTPAPRALPGDTFLGGATAEGAADGAHDESGDDIATTAFAAQADGCGTSGADTLRFGLMTGDARAEIDAGVPTALGTAVAQADGAPAHPMGAFGEHGVRSGAVRASRTRRESADATVADATANAMTNGAPSLDAATAANAAATASGLSAASQRALDTVDDALRAKIERVAERMRDEHGRDVEVVEGYRPQARQDALFAQGRETDGEVVTWTRHSQHTLGRAVDVTLDGEFTDPQGFAQLQQIAREEGLHTLGSKDPGHLELPRAVPAPATVPNATTEQASSEAPLPNAQVVSLSVSTPRRETKDEPRDAASNGGGPSRAMHAYGQATARAVTGVTKADEQSADASSRRAARDARSESDASRDAAPRPTADGTTASAFAMRERSVTTSDVRVSAPTVTTPVDLAGRVAAALDAREAAPALPMSHITLRLENLTGGEDRIRIGLRGMEVGASIDVGDRGAADRMRMGVGELRDALDRHGLTADTVQISTAAPNASGRDAIDAGRAAAAAATTIERAGAGSGAGAGDGAGSQQQRHAQDARGESRREDADRRGRRDAQDAQDAQDRADRNARKRARR